MYIRPEQIAEQYEMEVKSISKGRDCFLCETDLGMRALKEYRGSVERAEFLAGMLDFLKGQNIVAEQIFYTKEGEIFARDEEEQNICYCQFSVEPSAIRRAGRTWCMR